VTIYHLDFLENIHRNCVHVFKQIQDTVTQFQCHSTQETDVDSFC